MIGKVGRVSAAIGLALMAIPAQAQIGPFAHRQLPTDVSVSVGVSIPLGGPRQSGDNAPRLSLNVAPQTASNFESLPVLLPHTGDTGQPRALPLLSLDLGPRRELNLAGYRIAGARYDLYGANEDDSEGGGSGLATGLLIGAGVVAAVALTAVIACDADERGNSPCAGE